MSTTIKIRGARPPEGESLCKFCRWVHMQRGFRESEEAIFCNFNMLRAVTFKVAECTDFENRSIPQQWEMEKMALMINVEPTRRKAGFSGSKEGDAEKEDVASVGD
jgi:hypothetical protein